MDTYLVIVDKMHNYNRVSEAAIQVQSQTGSPVADSDNIALALVCAQFLEENLSQITKYGLSKLMEALPPMKPAVFFRNNHFSTIINSQGQLWTLATDEGFLELDEIVWESVTFSGDSEFVNGTFGDYQNNEVE